MKDTSFPDWTAKTERAPIQDADGVWRQGIAVKGQTDANGNPMYVGYIGADDSIVPVGNDDGEGFRAMLANAAEGSPPADAVPTPDAAAAKDANAAKVAGSAPSGATLKDASIPTPSGTSSGSTRSSKGGGWVDYGDDGYSSSGSGGRRSSGGWRDYGDDSGGRYEGEFTADDFMEAADGDRKKATTMARSANKRRKKKGGVAAEETSGIWPGFPFQRPPSPIRQHVLTALQESRSASGGGTGRARR